MWGKGAPTLICAMIVVAASAAATSVARSHDEPFLGVWLKPETSASAVARQLDDIRAMGFTAVYVAAFYQGYAIYPSRVVPQRPDCRGRDPLAICVREARRRGLDVYAKIETFYWRPVGPTFKLAPSPLLERNPDWLLQLRDGSFTSKAEAQHDFVNPAHAEVRETVARLCEELATRYAVAGIALDYVRYPDGGTVDAGYDPTTRRIYRERFAKDPLDIAPTTSSAEWRRWVWFREMQVLETVRLVRERVKRAWPQAKLCAAVFPMGEERRYVDTRFQNWREMMSRGYLDAILPMAYEWSLEGIEREVRTVLDALPPSREVAVWPVLAIQRRSVGGESAHPPIIQQLELMAALGVEGASIFSYGWIQESAEGPDGVRRALDGLRQRKKSGE